MTLKDFINSGNTISRSGRASAKQKIAKYEQDLEKKLWQKEDRRKLREGMKKHEVEGQYLTSLWNNKRDSNG